jgi:hypothetical protein
MLSELSVKIVGANYPNSDGGNRRSEIAFCDPGEQIGLRPEPHNPHDEHAIAAFSARGFQIGYVASDRAVLLGGFLRDGRTVSAIFQDVAVWGAIARVGVDCEPTLPPIQAPSDQDDTIESDHLDIEFWPDEFPPDDC